MMKENTKNLKHRIENFDLRFQIEYLNIVHGLRFRVRPLKWLLGTVMEGVIPVLEYCQNHKTSGYILNSLFCFCVCFILYVSIK